MSPPCLVGGAHRGPLTPKDGIKHASTHAPTQNGETEQQTERGELPSSNPLALCPSQDWLTPSVLGILRGS